MDGGSAIESESKRRKLDEDKETVDRLSNLPDGIVSYILSFLPIKEAVMTCILSKRWQFSWISVSKVELADRDLVPAQFQRNKRKSSTCFAKIVDRVLKTRDSSSIEVFKLHSELCGKYIRPSRIRSWISTAIMLKVEELDVHFYGPDSIALPPPLYTCERLRVLNLDGRFTIEVPDTVCLNSLKTLHLNDVDFFDESSLNKLLSSCEIEDLTLIRCSGGRGWMSSICSTSLKCLSITDWLISPHALDCRVVVDTPQLQQIFFSLKNGSKKRYSLKRLPSLDVAKFAIVGAINANVFVQLLESISNAKILIFFPYNDNVPEDDHCPNLPVFHNLKCLAVKPEKHSWKILELLRQLPKLAALILCELNKHGVNEWHEPADNVAKCLCLSSYLEKVTVTDFAGSDIEMKLLEYILKTAKVLKTMTLCFQAGRRLQAGNLWKEDIRSKLLSFPKGSSSCQIKFLDS